MFATKKDIENLQEQINIMGKRQVIEYGKPYLYKGMDLKPVSERIDLATVVKILMEHFGLEIEVEPEKPKKIKLSKINTCVSSLEVTGFGIKTQDKQDNT